MPGGCDPEVVRGLQERAARALPAEHTERTGGAGWWLRHAPGCSWWIGTVLPHGAAGADDVRRGIAAAEEFYARRGSAARFQITPGACPAALDALLAERGYRRESPVSLQAAPAARVRAGLAADGPRVRLAEHPAPDWLTAWRTVQGGGDATAEEWLLGRGAAPSAYASALVGDEVAAVGRAVAESGWAGVFGMGTLPAARGRGTARAVLAELAGWAGARGADRLYLQVERGNAAALRLYRRAGFTELCAYHYRTGPPGPR